ncbi:AAA family ATPase [Prevotella copri]|uniref:AAA family ATPase n=1 Tax=Segatella copri TaxID=165179 RepID=UPI001C38133B|nr:AAA family ATPase [Segatella copri]
MRENEQSFVFGVSVSDYNFIGRKEEIRRLKMNFEEGINTILISPRRWGKTSLVRKVCEVVDRKKVIPVFVDIFKCKTEYEFYNALAEAVLKQTASKAELWMDNARDFIARLSPKVSFSPEPNSEFALSLGISPKTHAPEEILSLAEEIAKKKQKRIVVCIDEFQQIGEMADSVSIQKRLRSVWQHQRLTSYCLFGSKKHTMMNVFQKRNMPLYQFGDFKFLDKIPTETWVEYIVQHFKDRQRTISTEQAAKICQLVDNYSSYVQQLSWLVFSLIDEGQVVTDEHLKQGVKDLLNSQEQLFMQQIEPLTAYQMNFLRCILSGHHDDFGETAVREEFQLGSVSNITRLKTALVDKDIVEMSGKRYYITDPVFALWFRSRMF